MNSRKSNNKKNKKKKELLKIMIIIEIYLYSFLEIVQLDSIDKPGNKILKSSIAPSSKK